MRGIIFISEQLKNAGFNVEFVTPKALLINNALYVGYYGLNDNLIKFGMKKDDILKVNTNCTNTLNSCARYHNPESLNLMKRVLHALDVKLPYQQAEQLIEDINRRIQERYFTVKAKIGSKLKPIEIHQPSVLYFDNNGWNTQLNISIFAVAYYLKEYGESRTLHLLETETHNRYLGLEFTDDRLQPIILSYNPYL